MVFTALYGWHKIKQLNTENKTTSVKLSLLIPFRNEEENLQSLFVCLKKQTIKPFEIIFINDHSTDGSSAFLEKAKSTLNNINVLENTGKQGKKHALAFGLHYAKGDWIVQTDADCILPEKWIETITNFIENHNEKVFVSAAVAYSESNSFFNWFFELDFMSLVFTGAGFIGAGKPVFCNGANMAYKREEALKLNDPYFSATPSGDDVFLMQQLAAKHKNRIAFLKSYEAIVRTKAPERVSDFMRQRIRWGSKAKHYKNGFAGFVSVVVFLTNLAMPLLYVPALSGYFDLIYAISFSAVKITADILLLSIAAEFFRKTSLIALIIPACVIYPFYIIVAAIASVFVEAEWKK